MASRYNLWHPPTPLRLGLRRACELMTRRGFALALPAMAATAQRLRASDVTGKWTGEIENPRGAQAVTLELKADAYRHGRGQSQPCFRDFGRQGVGRRCLIRPGHASGRDRDSHPVRGKGQRRRVDADSHRGAPARRIRRWRWRSAKRRTSARRRPGRRRSTGRSPGPRRPRRAASRRRSWPAGHLHSEARQLERVPSRVRPYGARDLDAGPRRGALVDIAVCDRRQ